MRTPDLVDDVAEVLVTEEQIGRRSRSSARSCRATTRAAR